MKKFTLSLAFAALMTAVALIFSGCSDDPDVGPEAPVISAEGIQVPASAGKQKLAYSIANPVEGQSIVAESDQTWIHDFEYTDAQIAFQVDANEGEARTATLTLKYEGAADLKVEVKQMAFDASIDISPKTLSFAYTGGEESVTVTSSGDWTLTVPSGSDSWVVPSATSGKSGDVVKFNVAAENDTEEEKTAEFTFDCKGAQVTLTVTQNVKGQLIFVTESPLAVAPEGETVTVKLQTNIEPVTAKINVPEGETIDWITDVTTRAMTEKEFQFKVEPNNDDTDRSVTITFSNTDATEQFVITQESTNPNIAKKLTDELFRKYIMENYDLDEDGVLTTEEAANVTSITLDGDATNGDPELRPIASLAGIEYFPELTALKLNWITPAIEAVDLSKNTKLTSIDMTLGSGVMGINCANLPELTYFQMKRLSESDTSPDKFEDTGLETINLDGCPKLGEISVVRITNLRTLSFKDSKDLATLTLESSFADKALVEEPTTIDISVCPNLSKFICASNLGKLVLTQAQYDKFYEDLAYMQESFFGIWAVTDAPDVSEDWDPVFRAACIEQFDLDGNGKLSQIEVNKVSGTGVMLVIDKDTPNVADLKSLKGIENFVYLRNIYITGATALEDVDLSALTFLENLSLSLTNSVQSLKFPSTVDWITTKVELIFSDPAVNEGPVSLDFSPLAKSLAEITIRNASKLTDMNIAGCEKLAALDIATGLDALTTLDISESPLLTDNTKVLFGDAMKEVGATDAQAATLSTQYPNISFGAADVAKNVDPVIREVILKNEDYNPDQSNTVITQEVADAVTSINIHAGMAEGANVKSLAGLEVFKNMTSFAFVGTTQFDDVDLSGCTALTTITVSPSKGYNTIKLPAGVVSFTSVCSDAASIGPKELDLTAYTNLESVDVGGTSFGSGSKALVSLNCKGLANLKLIRAAFASATTINISGCDLLTEYVAPSASEGANLPFDKSGVTIIVGSQTQYDALKNSWIEYYGESPYCDMVIEE